MNRPDAPFRWLGHATVLLPGPPVVVIDPWRWRLDDGVADVLLVTHGHVDHCSHDDLVAAARSSGCLAIGPSEVADRLRGPFGDDVVEIAPGAVFESEGLAVTALPAEGPVRDGVPCGFHPAGHGVSYVVEVGGHRYLHLGDSRALPEHEGLDVDVAFIPVGGMVVMDPEEAAHAAQMIGARLSVPIHWGDLNGRYDLARRFAGRCAERNLRTGIQAGAGTASA